MATATDTADNTLDQLRTLAGELGRSPRQSDLLGRHPSYSVLRRRYGSLSAALKAAGLAAKPKPRRVASWPLTAQLDALRAYHATYGSWPTANVLNPALARKRGDAEALARWQAQTLPHYTTVRRTFGSLSAAISMAAGR